MNEYSIPEGTKAMIFAAGLGTRLKPFTDQHPKALFPIHGKPLLQRNIEHLKSHGIKDIIINIHHFADQIIDFIRIHDQFGINISFSHEEEEPLETGGGLKKASWFFADSNLPFVVINADILSNIDLHKMHAFHVMKNGIATLAATNRNSSRCLLQDDQHHLIGWKNMQTGEERISRSNCSYKPVAFSGIHIIKPEFISHLSQEEKFSIIDSYLDTAKNEDIFIYQHDGDIVVDVGKPDSIEVAERLFPL
ncbi:MAG: nucleotidyltransferase family protein [Chitinophagaceae bacterium]